MVTPSLHVRETDRGVIFSVHVLPRSKKEGVAGLYGDALKVRISAPPVEGAANKALIKLLAKLLGVPKGNVEILRGETGRNKQVIVHGVKREKVLDLLK